VHDEQLLEVEERAAVRRALPYLHDGGPLVGVGLGVAEAVVDGELDDVGLLHGDAALQAVQEEDTQHQFNARESDWGFTSFMPLSELYDPSRGFVNDTVLQEAPDRVGRSLCRP